MFCPALLLMICFASTVLASNSSVVFAIVRVQILSAILGSRDDSSSNGVGECKFMSAYWFKSIETISHYDQ